MKTIELTDNELEEMIERLIFAPITRAKTYQVCKVMEAYGFKFKMSVGRNILFKKGNIERWIKINPYI